jgi:hypothetical protein
MSKFIRWTPGHTKLRDTDIMKMVITLINHSDTQRVNIVESGLIEIACTSLNQFMGSFILHDKLIAHCRADIQQEADCCRSYLLSSEDKAVTARLNSFEALLKAI